MVVLVDTGVAAVTSSIAAAEFVETSPLTACDAAKFCRVAEASLL